MELYIMLAILLKIDTSKPIDSSAGKCQLVLDINVNKIKINMGSTVSFKVKQNGKTYGKFLDMYLVRHQKIMVMT